MKTTQFTFTLLALLSFSLWGCGSAEDSSQAKAALTQPAAPQSAVPGAPSESDHWDQCSEVEMTCWGIALDSQNQNDLIQIRISDTGDLATGMDLKSARVRRLGGYRPPEIFYFEQIRKLMDGNQIIYSNTSPQFSNTTIFNIRINPVPKFSILEPNRYAGTARLPGLGTLEALQCREGR